VQKLVQILEVLLAPVQKLVRILDVLRVLITHYFYTFFKKILNLKISI
jgi:hypothetical protein